MSQYNRKIKDTKKWLKTSPSFSVSPVLSLFPLSPASFGSPVQFYHPQPALNRRLSNFSKLKHDQHFE
jgi:hypothetical protein